MANWFWKGNWSCPFTPFLTRFFKQSKQRVFSLNSNYIILNRYLERTCTLFLYDQSSSFGGVSTDSPWQTSRKTTPSSSKISNRFWRLFSNLISFSSPKLSFWSIVEYCYDHLLLPLEQCLGASNESVSFWNLIQRELWLPSSRYLFGKPANSSYPLERKQRSGYIFDPIEISNSKQGNSKQG